MDWKAFFGFLMELATTWGIKLLGAIVVLCAAVTLMLHFEIKVEEEKLKMQIQEAEVLHHEIDITE